MNTWPAWTLSISLFPLAFRLYQSGTNSNSGTDKCSLRAMIKVIWGKRTSKWPSVFTPPLLWHHIWDTSQFGLGLRRRRRRRLAAHSWSPQRCCCFPWLCLMTAVYSGKSGRRWDWLERGIAMCQWVRERPKNNSKKTSGWETLTPTAKEHTGRGVGAELMSRGGEGLFPLSLKIV